jgi:hypothetical protein
MSPFEADLGYIPRMPLDVVAAGAPRRSPRGRGQVLDGRSFAMQMADVLTQLKRSLQHAQEQQIAEANKHRQPHTFQQGDKVLLSTKNLPITYATAKDDHRKTLHHKYIGEFELGERRGENAFDVLLPSHWRLARTFNVDRLKHSTIDHSRPQAPAPALRVEGTSSDRHAEYGVEEIRSWRRNPEEGGRLEYEVKWEDDEELSWEPEESFGRGGKEILEEFKKRDAQLQAELAMEGGKAEEQAKVRRSARLRRKQAHVMEIADGTEVHVFDAEDN